MPKGIGYPEKDKKDMNKIEVNKMTRKKEVGGKSSDMGKDHQKPVKK